MKNLEKQEEVKNEVIREYCCQLGDPGKVFKVLRPFYLKIRNGPNVIVEKNQVVELGKETSEMLFSVGKIEPEIIPEKFKVRVPFRTTINGLFVDLRLDDIVEFDDPEEALKYWRQNYVSPIQEGG